MSWIRTLGLLLLTGCGAFGSPSAECPGCVGAVEVGYPLVLRLNWEENCGTRGKGIGCDAVPVTAEISCGALACVLAQGTQPITFAGKVIVALTIPTTGSITPSVKMVRTDTGETSERAFSTQIIGEIDRLELACGGSSGDCVPRQTNQKFVYELFVDGYINGKRAAMGTKSLTGVGVTVTSDNPASRLSVQSPTRLPSVTVAHSNGTTASLAFPLE